jgi:hypothetical protein
MARLLAVLAVLAWAAEAAWLSGTRDRGEAGVKLINRTAHAAGHGVWASSASSFVDGDNVRVRRVLGTPKVKWESWKHKKDLDELVVSKLQEDGAGVSALAGPEPEERLRGKAKLEAGGEERYLADALTAETNNPSLNVWGRWSHDAERWLSREAMAARADLAFGVLTSGASAARLGLLKHWWCVVASS